MANLKIFVSSTCYDLGILRSNLRNFCTGLGYEPVMSDYSDVLYDPRAHTHSSCIQEVNNVDVLILVVGSRFGGTVIPKALGLVDIENARQLSKSSQIFEKPDNLSITQLEVIKAIQLKTPIFAFVDNRVLHDHAVYEKNKSNKAVIDAISFPSIEKPETAKYIFEFINFLRHLTDNNSIQGFSKSEDIEVHLRKQWSGLFQRLLYEQKIKTNEERQIEYLSNQIADIKTAIMASISNEDLKNTAKGAIRFRTLIEMFFPFKEQVENLKDVILSNMSWSELFNSLNIKEIKLLDDESIPIHRRRVAFILFDDTFYLSNGYLNTDFRSKEWSEFKALSAPNREAIYNAIEDISSGKRGMYGGQIKYYDITLEDFLKPSDNNVQDDDNDLPF